MKRRSFIKHTNKTENKVKKEEEKCLKKCKSAVPSHREIELVLY